MGIFSAVVLYLIIWWMTLFCVLPFGAAKQHNPPPGTSPSAPEDPKLKQKFFITSVLAAVIWAVIIYLIHIEFIDFHSAARAMFEEDRKQ